jgi:hypothetical protein
MVCTTVYNPDGTVKQDNGCKHNMLFLNGKNATTQLLFAVPALGWTQIQNITLGNGTTAPHQTSTIANFGGIGDCGLTPQAITWISVANSSSAYVDGSGNVSANHLWTATCGSGTGERVNQTAIGNNTANAAPFFAANTFTDVYLQSGDQLNVTWYVWIT